MGHATLGAKRPQLPFGDYICYIVDVEVGEQNDLKNPGRKKPCFIWNVDVYVPKESDGFKRGWNSQKIWTPTSFTDMGTTPPPKPQFVSGLNKLVRACGETVPQTAAAVEEWDEESLCGLYFILHLEEDEESGGRVKKFLKVKAGTKIPGLPAGRETKGKAEDETEEGPDPFDAPAGEEDEE